MLRTELPRIITEDLPGPQAENIHSGSGLDFPGPDVR